MSISEARRQIDKALQEANTPGWNDVDFADRIGTQRNLVIAHGFSAIVEALAESKPYDGSLDAIRIPVAVVRKVYLDAAKSGEDEIGLEDLLLRLRSEYRSFGVDK